MPHRRTTYGFTIGEVMVVLAVVAIAAAIALISLDTLYLRQQLTSATSEIETLILQARMSALKEKARYRLVLHDSAAATPNTLELQRFESGSWTTLEAGTRALPASVSILGSLPTDSMDDVEVSTRGSCDTGRIYLGASDGTQAALDVEITCLAESS